MGTFTKVVLSGSTDGRGIKVTQTASPGDTIHTAHATNTDEVWLYACNDDASAITLTIQFGGTTDPDDDLVQEIPALSGLRLVVPGLVLTNSLIIKAYAGTGDKVMIHGYANRIS